MPARRSCVDEQESYICRSQVQSYTENINCTNSYGCTQWRSRLRHCATSKKVASLIPVGFIGIFH